MDNSDIIAEKWNNDCQKLLQFAQTANRTTFQVSENERVEVNLNCVEMWHLDI